MNTERIEALLEQLIEKQDQLILRIESLEGTIEAKLDEVNSGISDLEHASLQIGNELNWYGENHSFAKQLLESVDRISGPAGYSLTDIHSELTNITSELSSIDTNLMMKD